MMNYEVHNDDLIGVSFQRCDYLLPVYSVALEVCVWGVIIFILVTQMNCWLEIKFDGHIE